MKKGPIFASAPSPAAMMRALAAQPHSPPHPDGRRRSPEPAAKSKEAHGQILREATEYMRRLSCRSTTQRPTSTRNAGPDIHSSGIRDVDFLGNPPPQFTLRDGQFVLRLEIHPKLRVIAQMAPKP